MNNDEPHGSGTVRNISLICLALGIVGILIVSCGSLPQGNGVTWDNTAEIQRNETERIRITERGQTDRERIAADAATRQAWAETFRVVGVVAAIAGALAFAVWAWSRRPHRPVPQPVTLLLAHYPGHVAELIDGQWCVVNPDDGGYYTATDAARLLEMRRNEF